MTAANSSSSSTYAASDGGAYERFIGRWTRRLADRVVEETVPYPDGPLLDVGCGTGSVAAALRARHAEREIVGIDTAHAYLDFAARRDDTAGVASSVRTPARSTFPTATSLPASR